MSAYAISTSIEPTFASQTSAEALEHQAVRVLTSEQAQPGSELSIVVTDDGTMRDLNQRFRHVDEPTDVLSFGHDDGGDFAVPPGVGPQLGEVVISYPTAQRQAQEADHDVSEELLHLLTHGVLHILGYDHETPEEAEDMHAREEAALDGWQH